MKKEISKKWTLLIRKQDKNTFNRIKSGEKIIETRALSPNTKKGYYGKIKGGDIIIFKCDNEKLEKKVGKVRKYTNFEEYLEKEDLENIFGKGITKEKAKKIHYSFPNYKERLEKYGIVAFEIKNL